MISILHHKKTTLTAILLMTAFLVQGQYWFQIYHEPDTFEFDPVMTQTLDNGYFIGAFTDVGVSHGITYLADSTGQLLWTKKVYGNEVRFRDVLLHPVSGYLAGGEIDNSGSPEAFLTAFTSAGDTAWTRHYDDQPAFRYIDKRPDMLLGMGSDYSWSRVSWLDYSGDTLFTRTYDYGFKSEGFELFGLPDSGAVLFMSVIPTSGDAQRMSATKLDVHGDTIWRTDSWAEDLTEGADAITLHDGGFMMVGTTIAGGDEGIHMVRMDHNGAILWEQQHFLDGHLIPLDVEETHDGGFIMLTKESASWGIRHLVRTDVNGDTLWTRVYHDENGLANDLLETPDHNIAITGHIEPVGGGELDVYLTTADEHGYLPDCAASGDCLWPGDTDYDGEANIYDLLPIGIAYGSTGPFRTGGSLLWIPQSAPDWSDTLASGVNYKHIDTDGNETIEAADTVAIHLNYGLTHFLRPAAGGGGGPALYLEASVDSTLSGETVTTDVYLGTDSLPANLVYGLAFSIYYDEFLVDEASVHSSFDTCWLGDNGLDLLTLTHNEPGRLDLALTRNDQTERTGSGKIASIKWTMDDDIGGKTALEYLTAVFSIQAARVIHLDQNELSVVQGSDSVLVGYTPSGIQSSQELQPIKIWPNPFHGELTVQSDLPFEFLEITDVWGRVIYRGQQPNQDGKQIHIGGLSLSPGIYTISLTGTNETYSRTMIAN